MGLFSFPSNVFSASARVPFLASLGMCGEACSNDGDDLTSKVVTAHAGESVDVSMGSWSILYSAAWFVENQYTVFRVRATARQSGVERYFVHFAGEDLVNPQAKTI